MGATLDPVSPQVLISNLPASLQPSTTTFYFSPQQEAIQLQQAALMQTGKASFINGLSTDSTSQLTVNDQQKLVLYGNAVEYAKTNNIQLGQALTPEQVAGLSQPMLWYVEQTVPEPGCAATGNAKCPTVTALMPQVYLPENFTALSAGGQILASNDLSLNFGSTATGGSILNTGSITSGGTLTVNTGTLTNRANVVDVGEIWSYIKDAGYLKTTGTMVQPGGFMSAAAGGLTLNVDQFNQIGGALQLLDPNGQVDQAATQAFIAGVAAQLGDNFVQQTLQNDLHTDFVKQGGSFGIQQVGMIMASAMLAGALAPLMAGMVAAQLGSVAATFAAGGLGNVMASAALTAMESSTLTQAMFTGSLDFGSVMKTGLSAAITAGLLNGITYSAENGLDFASKVSDNSLSSLAGVKPNFVEGATSQAGTASAGFSVTQGVAILGQSVIQAGVQSTIQGGSFLDALKVSGVSNLSAALAFKIGDAKLDNAFGNAKSTLLGDQVQVTLGSAFSHAVLGCASSAALGTGCAAGAIGGATSAVISPWLAQGMLDGTPGAQQLTQQQIGLLVGIASLSGVLVSGLAGQDPNAAAKTAANEAQNNQVPHTGPQAPPPPIQRAGGGSSGQTGTSKPNQQGLLDEYGLAGTPNNAGNDQNFGTSFPTPESLKRLLEGLPQVATELADKIFANPSFCAIAPAMCGVIITASSMSGGGSSSNSSSSSGSNETNFTDKYLGGSGGRWGNADTRQLNYVVGQTLIGDGYRVTGGGGVASEEYIRGSGPGSNGGSYVDITAQSPNGDTIRVQTVSTKSDGVTPTTSEQAAAERIKAAYPNDTLVLIPKGATRDQINQAIQKALKR
ncbi:DUF637 domain-containing protein [Pandoraea sputorum]|uniref:DUF637 domain-containing protein n=1 Tax=Pandoraea sputorum TaxID=93222 RepID=UPI0030C6958C